MQAGEFRPHVTGNRIIESSLNLGGKHERPFPLRTYPRTPICPRIVRARIGSRKGPIALCLENGPESAKELCETTDDWILDSPFSTTRSINLSDAQPNSTP